MPSFDTTMGGAQGRFPQTTWGMVSQLGRGTAEVHRSGLETLCRRYWKPVYHFLRLRWGRAPEDSKDLTQAFFLWLLDGEALSHYQPERGGFRRYLKFLLGRFVSHEAEAMRRLKRGGGKKIFDLDSAPADLAPADPKALDPGEAFDRAWFSELMRLSVEKVRQRFLSEGRDIQVRIYEEYELATSQERPTQAELAGRHGVKGTDIANYLYAVREAIREEIRSQLRDTTTDERELQEEWDELVGP